MESSKLINNIINDLTNIEIPIEESLLKTKVLIYNFENEVFLNWVNAELNGYDTEVELPAYRVLDCHVIGNATNGFYLQSNITLSTIELEEDFREYFNIIKLYDSVPSLESLYNDDEHDYHCYYIDPKLFPLLSKNFRGGYVVQSASRVLMKSSIKQILSIIKSKLLDSMLEIKKEFGLLDEIDFVKNEKKIIQIFNNTIAGNNNRVIAGNKNKQK